MKNYCFALLFCVSLAFLVACEPEIPGQGLKLNGRDVVLTTPQDLKNKAQTVVASVPTPVVAIDNLDVAGTVNDGVSDIPGTLVVTGVSGAQFGNAAFDNGVITYTADAAAGGKKDSLTVQVSSVFESVALLDGYLTVEVDITSSALGGGGPTPLTAVADNFEDLSQNQLWVAPFTDNIIDVMANDLNTENAFITGVSPGPNSTGGIVELAGEGDKVSYRTGDTNSFGVVHDEFIYTIQRGNETSTATVRLAIAEQAQMFVRNSTDSTVTLVVAGRAFIIQPESFENQMAIIVSKDSEGQITDTKIIAKDYRLDYPVPGQENIQEISKSVFVRPSQFFNVEFYFDQDGAPQLSIRLGF